MSDEIRKKVREFLQKKGISFTANRVGKNLHTTEEGWKHRKYICVFEPRNESAQSFEFSQGIRIERGPTSADVLYSLILDLSCDDEMFEQWAENSGFESDSRKAERIYQVCKENSVKAHKLFSREEIEKLAEILRDY